MKNFFAALDEVLDDMDFLTSAGRNMGEIKNECKNMALFSNVISKGVALPVFGAGDLHIPHLHTDVCNLRMTISCS